MAGIEYLLIGENSTLADIKKELKWNEVYHHLASGF
jgi:L-arabinose isomerase